MSSMAEENASQTLNFQTEVKQLLHLMIHSLYSNPEVFLRELISNAADAADKLRFAALAEPGLWENDSELKIRIDYDPQARTITITDNGIGMSREEAISQLGTIARSGTAEFLAQLSGDQRKDAQLIGQFGVGFYAAFLVAERVEVLTRKAGLGRGEGVKWESTGAGEFSVTTIDRPRRGTSVILHLKEDALEFADGQRLRELVRRYSDHIAIPVLMRIESPAPPESDAGAQPEYEAVNSATALWRRERSGITEDEYREFYKHVAHDYADPLAWTHARVEGKLEYTTLLYIPGHAPFDLWSRQGARGLKLYVQRVFIMDAAEQFLPLYLRFVRGVIDTNDLPLNVSRELLQGDARVETIRKALTKRVLDLLERLAREEPEKYTTFWQEFGLVLKEGLGEDPGNRERIAGLLRFASTRSDVPVRSLDDYLAAMPPGQDKIYYLVADNLTTAKGSPHLEIFRSKGIEVLLLCDRVDEWAFASLPTYKDKPLQDVSRGVLDLENRTDPSTESTPQTGELGEFGERIQTVLGKRVKAVRASKRLTESPVCLVLEEYDLSPQLRELLKHSGQALPDSQPILELNLDHALVARLRQAQAEDFEDLALILFDQARVAAGMLPDDPADYLRRLNRLLTRS